MSLFITKIRQFLLKENYDFDRPDISFYNFHPQFRAILAIHGIFFGERNSYYRFIWPIYCILLCFLMISLQVVFVHRGITIEDYSFSIISCCYMIITGTAPCVNISALINKNTILKLVEEFNHIFIHICSLGPKYRKSFLNGQLFIWKLCYSWMILLSLTLFLNVLYPVLSLTYQALFTTFDENTIRPLSFPVWIPKYNAYATPFYEIFLYIESNICIIVILSFGGYIYILFHILFHYIYLMEMIILDFGVIFDDLDERVVNLPPEHFSRRQAQMILNKRIKRIVDWQLHVFKGLKSVSRVYGPPLVYQVMFSSFAICLTSFQVAQKLDSGHFDSFFAQLDVVIIIQLYIPCYLGTLLRNKSFEVGDACWNCGWYENKLSRLIRRDIVNIILRAQQPISIKFHGLPNLELETFSSVMTSAYSYFNLLRQRYS